jgi:F-type H+-transporting ATPase subunit delta
METLLFSKTQKEDFLQTLCCDVEFSEKTLHFLETMAEENRLILLAPVVSLLQDLWLEKNGIEKVKVFSVVPLGRELEKKLTQKLEESLGKKIILEQSIDESLIAGIKIQRGSIFYDFSLQGNLKKLKAAILADLPAAKNTFKGVLYAD